MDVVSTLTAWIELVFGSKATSDMSHIRLLRILRAARSLKLIRFMYVFKELSLIIVSIMNSILPMLWTFLTLFMLLFLFGVVFQMGVATALSSAIPTADPDVVEETVVQFGTFGSTLLTLFMCITGGRDWIDTHQLLYAAAPSYGALFVVFIGVMLFGMLNVITGIFIEGTLTKARSDRELAVSEERERRIRVMRNLLALFKQIDTDEDGQISEDDWMIFAHQSGAKAVLDVAGVDIGNPATLFSLIDQDGSQALTSEEFVLGSMCYLRGSGSIMEVESQLAFVRNFLCSSVDEIQKMQDCMAESLRQVSEQLRQQSLNREQTQSTSKFLSPPALPSAPAAPVAASSGMSTFERFISPFTSKPSPRHPDMPADSKQEVSMALSAQTRTTVARGPSPDVSSDMSAATQPNSLVVGESEGLSGSGFLESGVSHFAAAQSGGCGVSGGNREHRTRFRSSSPAVPRSLEGSNHRRLVTNGSVERPQSVVSAGSSVGDWNESRQRDNTPEWRRGNHVTAGGAPTVMV